MSLQLIDLVRLLRSGRFAMTPETACQNDIAAHFALNLPASVAVQREFRLSDRDRPDFMVDRRWAVEVKIRGAQPRAIVRQLSRYANHDQVEGIVLATARSVACPTAINGKPVHQVELGRAWL